MNRKIFVGLDLPETLRQEIREASGGKYVRFQLCRTEEDYRACADGDVEILLSRYRLPNSECFPNLKWVQTCGAGVDHVTCQALARTDVMFTTASGIHAECISEMVFAFILHFQRNFAKIDSYRRCRRWPEPAAIFEFFDRPELSQQTLVVVGFGAIGRRVAHIGKAFGMRVLAIQRRPEPDENADEVHSPDSLAELAAIADYLVLSVPLTPATRGLIGRQVLDRMKSSSVLINVARGALVDEPALIDALQRHRIGGAGLDVFQQEPLSADHPFYEMENVVMSPHVSGATPRYDALVVRLFADNLRRYVNGQPLRNVVDWSAGY
jgi:phosphoglycerate dehydrogenase-like enzyme